MLTQICLVIMTLASIVAVIILIRISSQAQNTIRFIQIDLHDLSIEMTRLLNSMNEFVRTDLHGVSEQTNLLVGQLKDLSTDLRNKSHSLNFLFKPFSFLNSKLDPDSSTDKSESNSEAIPQLIKWIASSARLFKKTKEVIKNYEKRT